MSTNISGIVANGVVVPDSELPEGVRVEIHLQSANPEVAEVVPVRITPRELRNMPRARRQAILANAAKLAEQDYRDDPELTGFDAFSEEALDDDETDSH